MNSLRSVLILLACLAANAVVADRALTTIGWVEAVRILPENFDLQAKIDTGADNSSLDVTHWNSFQRDGKEWVRFTIRNNSNDTHTFERPLEGYTSIKRKQTESLKRPVVRMWICIGNQKYLAAVNLANRNNFEFRMLIGRSFLKDRFLVDSSTTLTLRPRCKAQDLSHILETDWLQFKKDSLGEIPGTKVESTTTQNSDEKTVVNGSIPVNNAEKIDTVEVISRQTNKPVIQKIKAELAKDYETENHELMLFLTRSPQFEFRLRLIDNG